jgi:ABC-type sugar transport system ATPase subunit
VIALSRHIAVAPKEDFHITQMIDITGLNLSYPGRKGEASRVLRELELQIEEQETYVLLGPSGCGKSSILRAIAGLERPDAGTLSIGANLMFCAKRDVWVPPSGRPIGMVFQSYALWPHLSVLENICFPLIHGRTRATRGEANRRAQEALTAVQIAHLAEKPVTQISGGQQQRVALARAIAARPRVLLLDEPLSNLDPQLRVEVRMELRNLTSRLGITSVIVSHDPDDAYALADRVGVMNHGRLVQQGSPLQVRNRPASEFVGRLFGGMNVVQVPIEGRDADRICVRFEARSSWLPIADPELQVGQIIALGIRPEHLKIEFGAPQLTGAVSTKQYNGRDYLCSVQLRGQSIQFFAAGEGVEVGKVIALAGEPHQWVWLREGDQ